MTTTVQYDHRITDAVLAALGIDPNAGQKGVGDSPLNTSYATWWSGPRVEVFADVDCLTVAMENDDPRWVDVEVAAGGPTGGAPVDSEWRLTAPADPGQWERVQARVVDRTSRWVIVMTEDGRRMTFPHSEAGRWERLTPPSPTDEIYSRAWDANSAAEMWQRSYQSDGFATEALGRRDEALRRRDAILAEGGIPVTYWEAYYERHIDAPTRAAYEAAVARDAAAASGEHPRRSQQKPVRRRATTPVSAAELREFGRRQCRGEDIRAAQ